VILLTDAGGRMTLAARLIVDSKGWVLFPRDETIPLLEHA